MVDRQLNWKPMPSNRHRRDATAIALAVLLASCASSTAPRSIPATTAPPRTAPAAALPSPAVVAAPAVHADLSPLRPFYRYAAIIDVAPLGDHFDTSEPNVGHFRVSRTARGELQIAEEERFFVPGVSLQPGSTGYPDEKAEVGRAVEVEARRRANGREKAPVVHYQGTYRTVTVLECMAEDLEGRGPRRMGRYELSKLRMDALLTRVEGVLQVRAEAGTIDVPGRAQWFPVSLAPLSLGRRFSTDRLLESAAALIPAAQRYVREEPGPDLASFYANAPLVPATWDPHLELVLILEPAQSGPRAEGGRHFVVPLRVTDAVFGASATGAGAVRASRGEVPEPAPIVQATLVPRARQVPASARATAPYVGDLIVRVDDRHGHTWTKAFEVRGDIATEGPTAITAGLQISDAVADSALRDTIPPPKRGQAPTEVRVGRTLDLAVRAE